MSGLLHHTHQHVTGATEISDKMTKMLSSLTEHNTPMHTAQGSKHEDSVEKKRNSAGILPASTVKMSDLSSGLT